jgi:hypothetical protein
MQQIELQENCRRLSKQALLSICPNGHLKRMLILRERQAKQ